MLGAAWVRVSTGSQDESSQVKVIERYAREHGVTIVKTFRLKGYSASKGEQEPDLLQAIEDIRAGMFSALIATESSRFDRRGDLDAQAAFLLEVRTAGGDVVSITEPNFGKTDFPGRIVTLVAQYSNAEKSREVKNQVYRGMTMVRDNNAHHGPLPAFWSIRGEKHSKQAYCHDPAAVGDIYIRVANKESLASIGRIYSIYPDAIRNLIRFAAHHTGVIECSYTHEGRTERWPHRVEAVVESPLWWRANKVLDANAARDRANRGGRPVARTSNWISGILDCPTCDGRLYFKAGLTPAGNPRTPRLYCGGRNKKRLACGNLTRCDAQPIIDLISSRFAADRTEILEYKRVAGNAHELETLKASLAKLQAQLSITEDDDELDRVIAERKELKRRIGEFVIVPDAFDFAPTGETVSDRWHNGDAEAKAMMVRAAKKSYGMSLVYREGQWAVAMGTAGPADPANPDGIVDLGNGLCFRLEAAA